MMRKTELSCSSSTCRCFSFLFLQIGMGSYMDQSSGMGAGDQFSGQMGDTTQFLTPNDLISQRSSPDFMPGGKQLTACCTTTATSL